MGLIAGLVDTALASTHMDAIDALRAFFILASCTILSVSLLPDSLHSRFVVYGARATSTDSKPPSSPGSTTPSSSPSSGLTTRIFDCLASLRVPHSYFTHFYVASVAASVFWSVQLFFRGAAFQAFATRVSPEHLQRSMTIHQILLCWTCMLLQGVRRLYECFVFSRPSASRMWFIHWLVGLAFYLGMSVAVWAEGAGTLLARPIVLDDVKVTIAPSLRTFVFLPIFLLASGLQHDGHHYLFSLKKYTLPTHPLFHSLVCPHYTAECVVYLALAFLAAPQGELVNKTIVAALVFVALNLGLTAANTRRWYMQKFGQDSMRGKWNMIPGIY
ncbi:putative 3-oxo-5-alpha-steroid 4-dehydrogenase [Aspergillus saccharolyticus JOP 1030-1]|uniref:Polyprenal reductase n=1 Tax=Aspergillus saccharolyticus JOP 1030-1 TaxID=1450539 RepID=A0A318ZAA3_9EURO|nr:3-oxo-5-alpha-steroid 4-dehydrogenase [Aspergillus saccharolyticus JOP 1030-1]PYH43254.1 3-oxo-5-alpha-steroid 4-dehydrogenase [Aspergillus saccharolyticus JOP 1030-1]